MPKDKIVSMPPVLMSVSCSEVDQHPRTSGVLHLPIPDEKRFKNIMTNDAEEYQLQLRVTPGLFKYMKALEEESEATTVSGLIRMALQAFEAALDQYDEIHRCDGLIVSRNGVTLPNADASEFEVMKGKKPHRVNVVLRGAEYARLERIKAMMGSMDLAEIVATAIGVLDAMIHDKPVPAFSNTTRLDDIEQSEVMAG